MLCDYIYLHSYMILYMYIWCIIYIYSYILFGYKFHRNMFIGDHFTTKHRSPNRRQVASLHYSDVIMGAMASKITSLTIVHSTVYSGADQRNIKALRHWPLCEGFTGDRVNSPYKWPVTRKTFPFDDVIMDSKVHGANMGPIWGRQVPGGPHVGPMNFAIWDIWLCGRWFHFHILQWTPNQPS